MRLSLKTETLVRVVADAVMVSASLALGFALRYMSIAGVEGAGSQTARTVLNTYITTYARDVWLLVPVSVLVFYLSGFYTYGRAYSSRFKALIVLQAVTIAYLVVASASFFLPEIMAIPRSVLLASWTYTALMLVSARLWATTWRAFPLLEAAGRTSKRDEKLETVLVIGGAGYIGSSLLPKLLDRGYRVRVLDLFLYGREAIADLLRHPRLEVIEADFRHVDRVVEAMQGVDAVIHLGAIVGDPACDINAGLTIEVNLMATRMIAEVAKGSSVRRFLFASTCSVYGANDQLLDEKSALNPVSLYARSKIASEKVLTQLADDEFVAVVLRFATIYGLSGRSRFDLVANLLAAKAVTDGEITLFGGDQWRPFVHVDDVARGILCALEADRDHVRDQVFNVGSNAQNYTLGQVAEIIQQRVPEASILELGADGDRRNYRVNFSKIQNMLGFSPEWTLEQGVQQVVEAVTNGRVQDYRNSRYSNVQYLKERVSLLLEPEQGWAERILTGEHEGYGDLVALEERLHAGSVG